MKEVTELPFSKYQFSPLYLQPPFEYRDCWQMLVVFETDPTVVAPYIPKPLIADPHGTMTCQFIRSWASGFGLYKEIVVGAAATYKGRSVNHCLHLVLDNDCATAAGREIWGFPKKHGRIEFGDQDGVVRGAAERGGITICEAALRYSSVIKPEEIPGSAEYTNVKVIPSIKMGAAPDVLQLTSTIVSNLHIKQAFKGVATLRFSPSPADRIYEFPIKKVLGGYYYNYDLTLGGGEVLHDYLKDH